MKPVFQALFALIVIGAIGAVVLSFSIDGIVESNLEETASGMLETSVEVENANISILDGSGTINNIIVHNPEGFSENPAIQLQQISMKVKIGSLLSDTVIVENIRIKNPELYFEQKASGSNFDAFIDKMGSYSSSSETHLIVDNLLVEDGIILLSTEIDGEKSVRAEFTRIELEGIGRDGNNTIEQTLTRILTPVLEKALKEAATEGLLDKAKDALQDFING